MQEYVLGNKHIFTTPERYERTFKALGYIPYEKKEKTKKTSKKTEETEKQENVLEY